MLFSVAFFGVFPPLFIGFALFFKLKLRRRQRRLLKDASCGGFEGRRKSSSKRLAVASGESYATHQIAVHMRLPRLYKAAIKS